MLTEVRIPLPPPGTGTAYAKLEHPASGFVVVSAGVRLARASNGTINAVHIAVGGLGGRPSRATASEQVLQAQPLNSNTIAAASAVAADNSDPEDDLYATAAYKRAAATAYTRRALEAAARRLG